MTVTRLGQITAETGSQGEITRDGSGDFTLSSTVVRSGNLAWKCPGGASASGAGIGFSAQVGVRGNAALRYSTIGSFGGGVLTIDSALHSGYQFAVVLDSDANELVFSSEGVLLGTVGLGTHGFTPEAWHDMGFFYLSGSPGVASVYVDGAEIFTYSGALDGDIDRVSIWSGNGSIFNLIVNPYLDDFYVDGITLDEENAAPSSRRFLPSVPTVASSVQWQPQGVGSNLAAINDAGLAIDNDDGYNRVQLPDLQDIYAMQAVALPENYKIRAVIPTMIARKGDTGIDARIIGLLYDGLNYGTDTAKRTYVSYRQVWNRYETQPDGSIWDEIDYTSMLAGYKSAGTF